MLCDTKPVTYSQQYQTTCSCVVAICAWLPPQEQPTNGGSREIRREHPNYGRVLRWNCRGRKPWRQLPHDLFRLRPQSRRHSGKGRRFQNHPPDDFACEQTWRHGSVAGAVRAVAVGQQGGALVGPLDFYKIISCYSAPAKIADRLNRFPIWGDLAAPDPADRRPRPLDCGGNIVIGKSALGHVGRE